MSEEGGEEGWGDGGVAGEGCSSGLAAFARSQGRGFIPYPCKALPDMVSFMI